MAIGIVSVPAAIAGGLAGTVAIDIPYNEVAKNESFDGLMTITNTGTGLIHYRGKKSGIAIHPGQAAFKRFNRSEGLQLPHGEDEMGLKLKWDGFMNDDLSMIPAGGSAFFRVYGLMGRGDMNPSPRDSMIVHVIVGKDTFLSSDIVDLPVSSGVDPAALPPIATLKWSDGRSELIKRAVIGGGQFLLAVTPETSGARRVARIPPGCDVSVSHDPELARHDGIFTQKMIIKFTGGSYEDLVLNWARYQVVSGHPDTVPNAFMRLFNEEATAEEARKCFEENSLKPWLTSFGKHPFKDMPTSGDGKSPSPGEASLLPVGNVGSAQNREANTVQPQSTTVCMWIVWGASAAGVTVCGWLLFLFLRVRRNR